MGSALVLSLVMSKFVGWRNRRKIWFLMDFSHVTNAMAVQFANDNHEVKYVDLSECQNIAGEALNAVAHFCDKAATVHMMHCNLKGKSRYA